jgi:hypothetical protein
VHPHIQEDNGKILLREKPQSLFTRRGFDEIVAQIIQDRLQSEEIGRGVVYKKDIRFRQLAGSGPVSGWFV